MQELENDIREYFSGRLDEGQLIVRTLTRHIKASYVPSYLLRKQEVTVSNPYPKAEKFADTYMEVLKQTNAPIPEKVLSAVRHYFIIGFLAGHDNAKKGIDREQFRQKMLALAGESQAKKKNIEAWTKTSEMKSD